MAFPRFYTILAVLCCSIVIGQGSVTTQKPEIIPVLGATAENQKVPADDTSPVVVSAASTTTTPSPPKPDPSPSPSPEPTTTSTTTTPAPTTNAPTTTEPVPTTTVPTTTVTPSPEPKPTPAPGPLPAPTQGTWFYTDNSRNETCILVQFAAQLNVTYPSNYTSALAYAVLNVPSNASVAGGSCNATEQWIKLSWSQGGDHSMLLYFISNSTTKEYALKSLNITIDPAVLTNSSLTSPVELWHGVEWRVPLATSYRCAPSTQLNLTAEVTSVAGALAISQLQEEAFRTVRNNNTFSAGRECGGGDLPDAVPIAVGCALGGLVVVMLIAYLEGRRRSAARGYLSM